MNGHPSHCVAFLGNQRLAAGPIHEVAIEVKHTLEAEDRSDPRRPNIHVFDAGTSRLVDLDLRGPDGAIEARYRPRVSPAASEPSSPEPQPPATPVRRGRGRPKLGVVGKEVTLLPRHWEWLGEQPGGASVTLRKLVERARKENAETDQQRRSRDSAYRFMSALAGDAVGFEEASRALFAGDGDRFEKETETWPADVRDHVRALAARSFASPP